MRNDLIRCSHLRETGRRAPGEVCAAVVSITRPRACQGGRTRLLSSTQRYLISIWKGTY